MDSEWSEADSVPVFVGKVEADQAVIVGPPDVVRSIGQLLAARSGAATVLRSALVVLPAFQSAGDLTGGLVRLTDRSRQLLGEHGAALTSDGAVLGVARGADGRFAGVLTFEEAGRFTQLVPNLPMLVSAVALQAQLMVLERKLDDIQTDVSTLLRENRIQVLAESRAVIDILEDVHSDVVETGILSDDDWARVSGVETTVRTLHLQSRAHLEDMTRRLGEDDAGLRARVANLGSALRHDRLRFWLQVLIVAEAALTRWETLRLERLARQGDARFAREAEEIRGDLVARREFVAELHRRLLTPLESGADLGFWERLRVFQRVRLEALLRELEGLVAAFHPEEAEGISGAAAPKGIEGPKQSLDWGGLVTGASRRAVAPVRRLGTAARRMTKRSSEDDEGRVGPRERS